MRWGPHGGGTGKRGHTWAGALRGKRRNLAGRGENAECKRSKETPCFKALSPPLARGMGAQLQSDSPGCGFWGSFPATPGLLLPLSEEPGWTLLPTANMPSSFSVAPKLDSVLPTPLWPLELHGYYLLALCFRSLSVWVPDHSPVAGLAYRLSVLAERSCCK